MEINNIRIINHAKRKANHLLSLIGSSDNNVIERCFFSLVLLVSACYRNTEDFPGISFLRKYNSVSYDIEKTLGKKENPEEDREGKWDLLLKDYKFWAIDELDECILEFIITGYVDRDKLMKLVDVFIKDVKRSESIEEYREIWNLYHYSFADNEKEIISRMLSVFQNPHLEMNPRNLKSCVKLLDSLGESENSDTIIKKYFENMSDKLVDKDLCDEFVGDERIDKYLRELNEKQNCQFDVRDILDRIAKNMAWGDRDVIIISNISEDELYELLTEEKSRRINGWIKVCQMLPDLVESKDKTIKEKIKSVLIKIGRESRINRLRVKDYGIIIKDND